MLKSEIAKTEITEEIKKNIDKKKWFQEKETKKIKKVINKKCRLTCKKIFEEAHVLDIRR